MSVAGGHTQFSTENLSEGAGFVEAKTLRVLAIAADKRLPQAPDVPPIADVIPGFDFAVIIGVLARAGTPARWGPPGCCWSPG